MQTTAENTLNPLRYHLSSVAKKRLRWLYLLDHAHGGNVTRAATAIGISRQWLSTITAAFERAARDPRILELASRAPHHTGNRLRIPQSVEQKIIAVRDATPGWGKEKLAKILDRDHGIIVHPSTVNRYLKKRGRIDPKISEKNRRAWMKKQQRELGAHGHPSLQATYRPPKAIKDLAPGALVEKDMKFIPQQAAFLNPEKPRAKEHFFYQHTMIDSFTRLRALELVADAESSTAVFAHQAAAQRFPFPIACENTDNGSENNGDFSRALQATDTFHFYSSVGTPTDNPRVERSHLTDDQEFYQRGNSRLSYEEQKSKLLAWERRYNEERPHQALGYLTPMEFYQLWKRDPEAAQAIAGKWQNYLARQRKRLSVARRIKRKEQVENLMRFIDAKLNKKVELNASKLNLVKCQLCSWT